MPDFSPQEKNFGIRLKESRKSNGLTQKKLGELIGTSAQVISNWERGYTTGIGSEELKALSLCLKTSIDYLIFGQSAPFDAPASDQAQIALDELNLARKIKSLSPEKRKAIELLLGLTEQTATKG